MTTLSEFNEAAADLMAAVEANEAAADHRCAKVMDAMDELIEAAEPYSDLSDRLRAAVARGKALSA